MGVQGQRLPLEKQVEKSNVLLINVTTSLFCNKVPEVAGNKAAPTHMDALALRLGFLGYLT